MTREEWLEARRQGVSASDVAGILGLSAWSTPYSIYADKVGLVADKEADERMEFGKDIEQLVAGKWSKRTGLEYEWLDTLHVGKEPWMLATPDAVVLPDRMAGLEIKSTGYKGTDWGEEGTDKVPDHVVTQVQWQMVVTGWKAVNVVAFYTGPRKFESFLVWEDPELQTEIIKRCRYFWSHHVLPQVAPDLDWSDAASRYLKDRFPMPKEPLREASEDEGLMVVEYAKVSTELKRLEKEKRTLSNRLKEAIGEAKAIVGPGFKASWYFTGESTYTVHRQAGRTLRASGDVFKHFGEEGTENG